MITMTQGQAESLSGEIGASAEISADAQGTITEEVQAAEGIGGSGTLSDDGVGAVTAEPIDFAEEAAMTVDDDPPARETESADAPTAEQVREVADRLMEDRVRIAIDSEVGRVRGRFPEIKELDDIIRLKRYPEIKELVGRGYSLSDAVSLTYEDVYLSRREKAAAAQARSLSHSTSHLRATHPKGTGGSDVSESAIRNYMEAIPGSTREQAIAAHRKYKVMGK